MASITPQQVTARREALVNRDTGLRVIVLESAPETDDVECFAIKANGHWTEHTFASAGAAYALDPDPTQED